MTSTPRKARVYQRTRYRRFFGLLVLAALLTNCGGGDSSVGSVTVQDPNPITLTLLDKFDQAGSTFVQGDLIHFRATLGNSRKTDLIIRKGSTAETAKNTPEGFVVTGKDMYRWFVSPINSGSVLWSDPSGFPAPGFSNEVKLRPGQSIAVEKNWDQTDVAGKLIPPGRYLASIVFAGLSAKPGKFEFEIR